MARLGALPFSAMLPIDLGVDVVRVDHPVREAASALERGRESRRPHPVGAGGQDGSLAPRAGHDITYAALTGALRSVACQGEAPIPPLSLAESGRHSAARGCHRSSFRVRPATGPG
ncbi:hypothetical protein CcI49_29090 [Frankia sp. CcI49]|nr:hypothetical protein [Frankia sp. CcI49]ONH55561.1 hypothetical protein CcI49_29090 [Frankia sp. CcI49]